MKYKKGEFITIPNKDSLCTLSATAQALFVWICNYADSDGICFPSRSTLANNLNCAVRTVDSYLAELEDKGFVQKEHRFHNNEKKSNEYQILIIEGGGAKSAPGGAKNSTTPGAKSAHRTKSIITKPILSEQSSQSFEIVKETDDLEDRIFKTKKVTNKEVMEVLGDFRDILEVDITGWGVNTTQRRAISNLLSRGKIDPRGLIKSALEYVKDNRDDTYMKWIFSPDDLDKNWNHLKFYKEKKGY